MSVRDRRIAQRERADSVPNVEVKFKDRAVRDEKRGR
jgi:hypothetical protein